MANYAIGDVQGCFFELKGLLDEINFDPTQDKLWFVGDLINRGPDSLRTIEFIYKIKDSCNVVLGNHDIHFLAVAENLRKPNVFKGFVKIAKISCDYSWEVLTLAK